MSPVNLAASADVVTDVDALPASPQDPTSVSAAVLTASCVGRGTRVSVRIAARQVSAPSSAVPHVATPQEEKSTASRGVKKVVMRLLKAAKKTTTITTTTKKTTTTSIKLKTAATAIKTAAAATAKHPRKAKKVRARAATILTAAAFRDVRERKPVVR
ncbi:hypothetical protein EDC01DRAFT_776404 [Geopyxis carbonaria]|nr:hypothetical protein EDC01DRAFT_776404 [Geopyxis carbonaria]